MIIFDSENKTFILDSRSCSYVFAVNKHGCVVHLYYGRSIEHGDVKFLTERIVLPIERKIDMNRDLWANEMPCEYPSFGRGDFHEPCFMAKRGDGATMSEFRYLEHRIYDGAPDISGLPHARRGGQTLELVLKDICSDIKVVLNYTVYDDSDVIVRNARIINDGSSRIKIQKALSFAVDLYGDDWRLMRFEGDLTCERTPEVAPIGHGLTKLQSLRGGSSHFINPFAVLLKDDTSEERGECYGFQLVYSGSFEISVELNNADMLRVQGGISGVAFDRALDGGEKFDAPQALICYSSRGVGHMSRQYADFIRNYIMPPRYAFGPRPVIINSWESVYFDLSYDKLFPLIDESAKLGIDTFVLDDGWFDGRNFDDSSLGDWTVDKKKFPDGLKPIIDRCKQNGMKFGIWFEPEMISEKSALFRAHPDWAIASPAVAPRVHRHQLVLDFSRKEVVDYVFGAIKKILDDNDISYVKWDMNRYLSEYYSSALPADRQGELVHRNILGVYELAERLTSAFPDVFFEGCASGGGRFDAGMLYYFPQIWTSDDTDAYERARIQYGTSFGYPLSAMSCHVSVCPNHQTGRTTPFFTRGAVASLGAFGYELDLSKTSDAEKALAAEQIAEYKAVQDLIMRGDMYRLSSPFDSNCFCELVVSKDKKRAYLVGEILRKRPCEYKKKKFIKFSGLDDKLCYNIRELGLTASGAALSGYGVEMPDLEDYGAFVWHIEQAR